jgi:hypothetical protein
MGLDQYLYKTKYLSHWDHSKGSPEYEAAENVLLATGLEAHPQSGGVEVKVTAIYWRKANMIHRWIMANCFEEIPDVRYEVTKDNLIDLRAACQKVLKSAKLVDAKVVGGRVLVDGEWQETLVDGQVVMNPQTAIDVLPTLGGFFFGSTEYDEWYIKDLEYTVEEIDRVLADETDGSLDGWFEYYASW